MRGEDPLAISWGQWKDNLWITDLKIPESPASRDSRRKPPMSWCQTRTCYHPSFGSQTQGCSDHNRNRRAGQLKAASPCCTAQSGWNSNRRNKVKHWRWKENGLWCLKRHMAAQTPPLGTADWKDHVTKEGVPSLAAWLCVQLFVYKVLWVHSASKHRFPARKEHEGEPVLCQMQNYLVISFPPLSGDNSKCQGLKFNLWIFVFNS